CFALLDWSCDLLFSPTLPMGRLPSSHVFSCEARLYHVSIVYSLAMDVLFPLESALGPSDDALLSPPPPSAAASAFSPTAIAAAWKSVHHAAAGAADSAGDSAASPASPLTRDQLVALRPHLTLLRRLRFILAARDAQAACLVELLTRLVPRKTVNVDIFASEEAGAPGIAAEIAASCLLVVGAWIRKVRQQAAAVKRPGSVQGSTVAGGEAGEKGERGGRGEAGGGGGVGGFHGVSGVQWRVISGGIDAARAVIGRAQGAYGPRDCRGLGDGVRDAWGQGGEVAAEGCVSAAVYLLGVACHCMAQPPPPPPPMQENEKQSSARHELMHGMAASLHTAMRHCPHAIVHCGFKEALAGMGYAMLSCTLSPSSPPFHSPSPAPIPTSTLHSPPPFSLSTPFPSSPLPPPCASEPPSMSFPALLSSLLCLWPLAYKPAPLQSAGATSAAGAVTAAAAAAAVLVGPDVPLWAAVVRCLEFVTARTAVLLPPAQTASLLFSLHSVLASALPSSTHPTFPVPLPLSAPVAVLCVSGVLRGLFAARYHHLSLQRPHAIKQAVGKDGPAALADAAAEAAAAIAAAQAQAEAEVRGRQRSSRDNTSSSRSSSGSSGGRSKGRSESSSAASPSAQLLASVIGAYSPEIFPALCALEHLLLSAARSACPQPASSPSFSTLTPPYLARSTLAHSTPPRGQEQRRLEAGAGAEGTRGWVGEGVDAVSPAGLPRDLCWTQVPLLVAAAAAAAAPTDGQSSSSSRMSSSDSGSSSRQQQWAAVVFLRAAAFSLCQVMAGGRPCLMTVCAVNSAGDGTDGAALECMAAAVLSDCLQLGPWHGAAASLALHAHTDAESHLNAQAQTAQAPAHALVHTQAQTQASGPQRNSEGLEVVKILNGLEGVEGYTPAASRQLVAALPLWVEGPWMQQAGAMARCVCDLVEGSHGLAALHTAAVKAMEPAVAAAAGDVGRGAGEAGAGSGGGLGGGRGGGGEEKGLKAAAGSGSRRGSRRSASAAYSAESLVPFPAPPPPLPPVVPLTHRASLVSLAHTLTCFSLSLNCSHRMFAASLHSLATASAEAAAAATGTKAGAAAAISGANGDGINGSDRSSIKPGHASNLVLLQRAAEAATTVRAGAFSATCVVLSSISSMVAALAAKEEEDGEQEDDESLIDARLARTAAAAPAGASVTAEATVAAAEMRIGDRVCDVADEGNELVGRNGEDGEREWNGRSGVEGRADSTKDMGVVAWAWRDVQSRVAVETLTSLAWLDFSRVNVGQIFPDLVAASVDAVKEGEEGDARRSGGGGRVRGLKGLRKKGGVSGRGVEEMGEDGRGERTASDLCLCLPTTQLVARGRGSVLPVLASLSPPPCAYHWQHDPAASSALLFLFRALPAALPRLPLRLFLHRLAPLIVMHLSHPLPNLCSAAHTLLASFLSLHADSLLLLAYPGPHPPHPAPSPPSSIFTALHNLLFRTKASSSFSHHTSTVRSGASSGASEGASESVETRASSSAGTLRGAVQGGSGNEGHSGADSREGSAQPQKQQQQKQQQQQQQKERERALEEIEGVALAYVEESVKCLPAITPFDAFRQGLGSIARCLPPGRPVTVLCFRLLSRRVLCLIDSAAAAAAAAGSTAAAAERREGSEANILPSVDGMEAERVGSDGDGGQGEGVQLRRGQGEMGNEQGGFEGEAAHGEAAAGGVRGMLEQKGADGGSAVQVGDPGGWRQLLQLLLHLIPIVDVQVLPLLLQEVASTLVAIRPVRPPSTQPHSPQSQPAATHKDECCNEGVVKPHLQSLPKEQQQEQQQQQQQPGALAHMEQSVTESPAAERRIHSTQPKAHSPSTKAHQPQGHGVSGGSESFVGSAEERVRRQWQQDALGELYSVISGCYDYVRRPMLVAFFQTLSFMCNHTGTQSKL
ncbi:unnamed protein product, partial [Closterium sp. NIES-53]